MSFIKRHILILSTLTGAITGYFILHPFGMIIHKVLHLHRKLHLHIHWSELLIAFMQAFSLDYWPQSLAYIILAGTIGYLIGRILIAYREINEQLKKFSAIGKNAATIVHDLKNPLGIVVGCIDYIKSKGKDNELLQTCELLERQVKRLLNMIANIKITAQSASMIMLSKERINLRTFLNDVISNMLLNHRINLDLRYDREILIDKSYFERVFWNLFNNADEALEDVKDGRINVVVKESGNFVTVSINDNGRGIPREISKHLFEAGKTYGKKGGSGLGLYNCKKIVEAHGGKIWINSELGQGTTVFIEIPK
jgi:signal transduction histidine kinase